MSTETPTGTRELPTIDVWEHGREKDGLPQRMDRRLFMQLLVFRTEGNEEAPLLELLHTRKLPHVLYRDLSDPLGLGLLTWSEDPTLFVTDARSLFSEPPLRGVTFRSNFTMLGRTYSSGFEPDLAWWLLTRPVETVLNEAWPWAIWYPLRRSGEFAKLSRKDQGAILREHGLLGRAYAERDLAHDVRLACHGLDANDNEFVIGLIGKELHPLSHIVQAMRGTRQTSEYIVQMGPFFVGHRLRSYGGKEGSSVEGARNGG